MKSGYLFALLLLSSAASAAEPDFNNDGDKEVLLWQGATGVYSAIDSSGRLTQKQCGLPGDKPLFSDTDGDGATEFTVWRPSPQSGQPSTFYVCRDSGTTTTELGLAGDRPFAQYDFDGDDRTDFTVYRPSTGQWFIARSSQSGAVQTRAWGEEGDIPVPGDYDADGITDVAVFRPRDGSWWIVLSSTNGLKNVSWGLPYDIPVPRDYDGDGKTDVATWRPQDGKWYILPSANEASPIIRQFGLVEDVPLPTDMNGDGRDDLVIYRPYNGLLFWVTNPSGGTFALQLSTELTGQRVTPISRDKLTAPGDYDGDGRADYVVVRNQSGQLSWNIADSLGKVLAQQSWGLSGDTLLPGDYTGDGKGDLVVSRAVPSGNIQWFVHPTQGLETTFLFGLTGDRSISGDFDGDGRIDAAVIRNNASGGLDWFSRNSSDGSTLNRSWGLRDDHTITADLTGDGRADFTVVRNVGGFLNWFTISADNRIFDTVLWGLPGDTLAPGDYDGDGRADLAVIRNLNGALYLFARLQSGVGVELVQWGLNGDSPVPGRYTGGLTLQQGVWRGTAAAPTYFVERAVSVLDRGNAELAQFAFGLSADTVMPPGELVRTQAPAPPPASSSSSSSSSSGSSSSAPSGLGCTTIRELAYPDLWKKGSSSHIPGTDPRTGKPSLIGGKNVASRPTGNCVDILDSEGNKISGFGKYAVGGVYEYRYYVGFRTGECGGGQTAEEINRRAITNTGSPTIYLRKSSSLCLRISGGALVARQGAVR